MPSTSASSRASMCSNAASISSSLRSGKTLRSDWRAGTPWKSWVKVRSLPSSASPWFQARTTAGVESTSVPSMSMRRASTVKEKASWDAAAGRPAESAEVTVEESIMPPRSHGPGSRSARPAAPIQ